MAVIGAFDRLKDLDELAVAVDVGSGVRSIAQRQAAALANLGIGSASGSAPPTAGTAQANGAVVLDTNKSITGLGAVTSTSATLGIGYAAGAGGAVTQATSKSTGVTLNTVAGKITMNGAALAAAAEVAFTLTNSAVGVDDVLVVNVATGGTSASYGLSVTAVAAGSCEITLTNLSAGSLSEALVLNYVVLKGAHA